MSDFKLTADGTDIDLSTNQVELVTGTDAIAQHLGIRLKFVKGEYFLNRLLGVPYFEDILIKNPNMGVVASVYREVITETPGVIDITKFDLSYEPTTRKLTLAFSCSVTTQEEPLDYSTEFLIG